MNWIILLVLLLVAGAVGLVRLTEQASLAPTLFSGVSESPQCRTETPQNESLLEDFETGDFSKLPWRANGWEVTRDMPHTGSWSAKTKQPDGGTLEVILDIPVGGVVSFFIKSNANGDLRLKIDGSEVDSWPSTDQAWHEMKVPAAKGLHTFVWESFDRGNDDPYWLDDITIRVAEISKLPTSQPRWIMGTARDDILAGDGQDNTLCGLEGNDTLQGGAGNDTLEGGPGLDIIDAGDGDDTIYINAGDSDGIERITCGAGFDLVILKNGFPAQLPQLPSMITDPVTGAIYLNEARDCEQVNVQVKGSVIIRGTERDDTLTGTTEEDRLYGLAGNDIIFSGLGNDTVAGGQGSDSLDGGEGDDTLLGDEGDDTLTGGAGRDSIVAGSGDDTIIILRPGDVPAGTAEHMVCGSGTDTVILKGFPSNTPLSFPISDPSTKGSYENRAADCEIVIIG